MHHLKGLIYPKSPLEIVPIRMCDSEAILQFRNAQLSYLRQKKPLEKTEQDAYFQSVIWPQLSRTQPEMVLFSFLEEGSCVGYGGLVHIDWEALRAEISFLMDPAFDRGRYVIFLRFFLKWIQVVGFEKLKLHRLYMETYDLRPYHTEVYEDAGFRFEGRLKDHEFIDGHFVDVLYHGLTVAETLES